MFFALENLVSPVVHSMERPWEYESKAPYHLEKPDFLIWERSPDTVHRFIKGVEGLVPGLRVTESNPPVAIHALVADYDGIPPDNPLDLLLKKVPSDAMLPEWIATSRGGKPRLIWTFERPVSILDKSHGAQLLSVIGARVKAGKMFADLDKASFDMTTYFEIGRSWAAVPGGRPIPLGLINWWDYELYSRIEKKTVRSYSIPFEKVAEEAERRWPGRVSKFAPGAHCLRFWAPESDNKTGCMIYESGVRVYVPHDKPFMTWADIFGRAFVDTWQAEKYRDFLDGCYYETQRMKYWTYYKADNKYQEWSPSGFRGKLKKDGVSDTVAKGETSSPANSLMATIAERNRVSTALSYLWHKPGVIVKQNGDRILNTSTLRPAEPGAPLCAPGLPWESMEVRRAFPYIHRMLTCMFLTETEFQSACRGDEPKDNWQLQYLLAWLASYYRRSYNYQPHQGQALFICGPVNKGKSVFAQVVLSELMGGWADASQYFTAVNEWSNELLTVGVLVIDDDSGSVDSVVRSKFQTRIKRYVANASIYMNGKYMPTGTVPLYNRLVIMLNEDLISKQILPTLDASTKDKISFLLCGNAQFDQFSDIREENRMRVRQEIPAFARWLLEHEIPAELKDKRFGTVARHHPQLLSASMVQGYGQVVLEALSVVMPAFEKPFNGQIRQLLALLGAESKEIEVKMDTQKLQKTLAQLSKSGYDIKMTADVRTGLHTYTIPPDVVAKGPSFDKGDE